MADAELAEHRDALTPWVGSTVSGHSHTGGPATITSLGATEANRALVTGFAENVLKGAPTDLIADYVSSSYVQHNPDMGDGPDGLAEALSRGAVAYDRLHKVIAEGNFVLTLSEGRTLSTPTAFYDLFRADEGKVVEHWDVTAPMPATLPHNNGVF